MPAPPVLARVLRGGRVESTHRGDIAVVDETGRLLAASGDPRRPIFIRSAAKPFQALPLLEEGGAAAFRLGADEIALMCASHGGEPRHVRVAARLLGRGGFCAKDLVCGAHAPMDERSARALARRGERPTALHNNCSGKHAGLLLACRQLGLSPSSYEERAHPLQKRIAERLSDFSGVPVSRIPVAVDGCSLPAFLLPLCALARAYANLVATRRSEESRGARSARDAILRSFGRSPAMAAGRGRFTTDFLEAGGGRWIGKEGAEGVYAIALVPRRPGERAVGIAFKIEDGSSRARDAVALSILSRLGRLPAGASRRLTPYLSPVIRNARGREVGRIAVFAPLHRIGR